MGACSECERESFIFIPFVKDADFLSFVQVLTQVYPHQSYLTRV